MHAGSVPRRAIVMGGSMAGLLATRVLSDFFEHVTLIERDAFPPLPETRKGVPQGRHAHALLARGEQILSRFFPGLTDELVAGGGFSGDMGASIRWYQFGGYKVQHECGERMFTQSRPYLEWHVRRRVLARGNVEPMERTAVRGLQAEGDRVTGVALEREGQTSILPGDLVVDCTGRGSQTPRWLEHMGFAPPPESEIRVNLGYATRYYRRRPDDLEGARVLLVNPKPPAERRACALLPIEGDRWVCTLAGWLGDHPPLDPEGFLEFARNLPAPDLYNVISKAEPLSDAVPHRFPANLRRHYERLSRFPEGYLVLGDGVCSFNPVYGQGMSSAALQAEALQSCLSEGMVDDFARRYFEKVAKVVDVPWQLAAGEDFRFREVVGPKPLGTGLVNGYVGLVHTACRRNARVYSAFLRVLNLLAPPSLLFKPSLMWRVLGANVNARPEGDRDSARGRPPAGNA